MKKIKQETEIRNLKKELAVARELLIAIGVAPLIAYMPEISLKKHSSKPTEEQKKWIRSKVKEYKEKFKPKTLCQPKKK